MRLILFFVVGTVFLGNPPGLGKASKEEPSPFSKVLVHYIAIEKTLAQDNLAQLGELGRTFKESLETLSSKNLTEDEKKAVQDLLAGAIQFLDSKNNNEYRIRFGNISKIIVTHLKSHKEQTKDLQLFYCPMFPQGYAFWVQKKKEPLANPYWGKEMLTCGVKRPW